MLTTGLLSLSIHEPLTLDGIEIALHPDLFEDRRRPSGISISSIKAGQSGGQGGASIHRSTPGDSQPLSSQYLEIKPTLTDESNTMASTANPRRRFEVGNMLEIRVWDAIPGANIQLSPPPSTVKPPPTYSPHVAAGESSLVHTELLYKSPFSSSTAAFSSLASSLGGDESTVSSGEPTNTTKDVLKSNSLPNSPKDNRTGYSKIAVDSASKTVVTGVSSHLPPRHRPSSSDVIARTHLGGVHKLPLVNRTRISPALPPLDHRRDSKPLAHERAISDVTMETLGVNQLLDAESGVESVASQDEDDETLTKIAHTHTLRLSFVMQVTEKSLTSLNSNARTQVSLLRQVAELYNISSYDMVTVNRIEKSDEAKALEAVSADYVTLTIQDQFIGRGDMYLFQKSLIGSWIYEGQRINDSTLGIKANAREIRHKNRLAKSGIITSNSVITFRSRSARIMWLVQLSSEMWDYSSPYEKTGSGDMPTCELYFDKFVAFMYKLFKKWKALKVSHSLTVIFFSRTFIGRSGLGARMRGDPNVSVDVYERVYEDHYKIVVENETNTDWDQLVSRIKQEFVQFPLEVGWNLEGKEVRQPSNAMQGNVLEAINVCLNLLQFHYLDRDLHRTGNSIVVVSASNGVFEVDKGLASITFQRMMDNGIGSDMVSLGLPPLHIAPFFLYTRAFSSVDEEGANDEYAYYEVPHWMHLSFTSYDSDTLVSEPGFPKKAAKPLVDEGPASTISVAANGFFLPEIQARQEQISESSSVALVDPTKSFTPLANIAASPKPNESQSRHQRALIEGRDFQDILEACRPRQIHNLPSALVFHLTAKNKSRHPPGSRVASIGNGTVNHEATKALKLREWGTVDFDELVMLPLRTLSSGSPEVMPKIAGHDPESIAKSPTSSASSFASQISSAIGRSFDPSTPQSNFLGSNQFPRRSATEPGIKLKRSPSLEFVKIEDTDTIPSRHGTSDNSLSTRESEDWNTRKIEEKDAAKSSASPKFDENALRHMMRQHDKTYFQRQARIDQPVPSGSTAVGVTGSENLSVPDDATTLPRLTSIDPNTPIAKSKQFGGLGEAINQYNTSGETYTIQPAKSPSAIKRIAGSGNLGQLGPSRSLGKSPHFPMHIGWQSASGSVVLPDEIPRYGHLQLMADSRFKLPSLHGKLIRHESEKAPSQLHVQDGNSTHRQGLRSDQKQHDALATSRFVLKSFKPDSSKLPIERPSPSRQGHVISSQLHARDRKSSLPQTDPSKQHQSSKRDANRMASAFNPFRQRDEEEELAKKSHNRRRWSHVFPLGEVEFKRHSGPSWKSLCQPAILPLTIDYLPALRDEKEFDVHPYQVTLFGTEQSHYTTHKELYLEMVRHRLTQDYQVVPSSVVAEASRRDKVDYLGGGPRTYGMINPQNRFKGDLGSEQESVIQHILSMGHRVHILAYNPSSDTIDVTIYNKKVATKPRNTKMSSVNEKDMSSVKPVSPMGTDNIMMDYRYSVYSPATSKYAPIIQRFKKYSELYKWNAVDHILLGDSSNNSLDSTGTGMRFRRLMFTLIPPKFDDLVAEQAYISNFKRLLEYLGKLRERKGVSADELSIKMISSSDEREDPVKAVLSVHPGSFYSKNRKTFMVDLRKGKHDLFEWLEFTIDAEFDTMSTYRLMINWLVASSSKVETQVQLLHRRCTQYGLKLQRFPQMGITRNLFLNPYHPPTFIVIRDETHAKHLDSLLLNHDFVDEGIQMTHPTFVSCIEHGDSFSFQRGSDGELKDLPGRQYIHRPTGALFVRLIRDRQGWAVVACMVNYQVAPDVKAEAIQAVGNLKECMLGISAEEMPRVQLSR